MGGHRGAQSGAVPEGTEYGPRRNAVRTPDLSFHRTRKSLSGDDWVIRLFFDLLFAGNGMMVDPDISKRHMTSILVQTRRITQTCTG